MSKNPNKSVISYFIALFKVFEKNGQGNFISHFGVLFFIFSQKCFIFKMIRPQSYKCSKLVPDFFTTISQYVCYTYKCFPIVQSQTYYRKSYFSTNLTLFSVLQHCDQFFLKFFEVSVKINSFLSFLDFFQTFYHFYFEKNEKKIETEL